MYNAVTDTLITAWRNRGNIRETPSGWIPGNAVCCSHRGQRPDTRGRGGIIIDAQGGVNYNCFNCKFRTRYAPGGPLSIGFRKFLSWLGISDSGIRSLILEALRVSHQQLELGQELPPSEFQPLDFPSKPLPENSLSFREQATWISLNPESDIDPNFSDQVNYIWSRGIDMQKYDFYWCNSQTLRRRVIIPFLWQDQLVGYQTRSIDAGSGKYYSEMPAGYVFNINRQQRSWKQVFVAEGAFDAMSLDGCATLGSTVSEYQASIIESLNKPVIVVPDRDRSGADLIDSALRYHWSVSFPIWFETCKDINEALVKYGRLFTIRAILDAVETSQLKIEILKRRWY
jgi:hypothetical protein